MTNKKRDNILFESNTLPRKEILEIIINLKENHLENLSELRLQELDLEKQLTEIDYARQLIKDNLNTLNSNLKYYSDAKYVG